MNHLVPGWDLPETDYLFSLCKQYDLRWPIIWDRFDWPGGVRRSIEVGNTLLSPPSPFSLPLSLSPNSSL